MALVRRVIHLREHNATSTTPIATYFESNRRRPIKTNYIMIVLRHAVRLIGPEVGLVEADVSARSLWADGAMVIMCAQVDDNIIHLLGRWQSDVMLHSLHMQAHPVVRNFASQMLQHGMFDLIQNVQQQNPQDIYSHPHSIPTLLPTGSTAPIVLLGDGDGMRA
jgi:hypothetical protein